MGIVISVVLGLLALAFVLQPLYKQMHQNDYVKNEEMNGKGDGWGKKGGGCLLHPPDAAAAPLPTTSEAAPLMGQTERELAARSALHEVELDYQLGNIAEDDYRTLRERYMRRALRELKARYDREQELDEVIEEQLRQLKEEHEQTT